MAKHFTNMGIFHQFLIYIQYSGQFSLIIAQKKASYLEDSNNVGLSPVSLTHFASGGCSFYDSSCNSGQDLRHTNVYPRHPHCGYKLHVALIFTHQDCLATHPLTDKFIRTALSILIQQWVRCNSQNKTHSTAALSSPYKTVGNSSFTEIAITSCVLDRSVFVVNEVGHWGDPVGVTRVQVDLGVSFCLMEVASTWLHASLPPRRWGFPGKLPLRSVGNRHLIASARTIPSIRNSTDWSITLSGASHAWNQ